MKICVFYSNRNGVAFIVCESIQFENPIQGHNLDTDFRNSALFLADG